MLKALQILKEMLEQNQDSDCINELKEAIEELEALNNRSCNNCKIMFSDHTVDNDLYCTKICKWVEKDFCCNKWEPK